METSRNGVSGVHVIAPAVQDIVLDRGHAQTRLQNTAEHPAKEISPRSKNAKTLNAQVLLYAQKEMDKIFIYMI